MIYDTMYKGRTVDQQGLLSTRHAVGTEPVALVLSEARDHLALRGEEVLVGAAHGALVVVR
jgi:hypothetical protein